MLKGVSASMQIYTRIGDKGQTKVVGNYTISKDSARVNAYGTTDELNSLIGVTVTLDEVWPELKDELQQIQQFIFDCGNDLATSQTKKYSYRMDEKPTLWLESLIDDYSKEPKPIEAFVLPGGSKLGAQLHHCRTVTRRTEREIVTFFNKMAAEEYETGREESEPNAYVLKFINRLSDYFFALARVANHRAGIEDIDYERSGKVFHELSKEDLKF